MSRLLKRLTAAALKKCSIYPAVLTDSRDVAELVLNLHPKRTEVPLVRMGPKGDGGYLVPNDLSNLRACFSPGVNTIAGFEEDCAKLDIQTFMADASVSGPPVQHPLFHFTRKYIGATSNASFMTLDEWVTQSLPMNDNSDVILQMDIEGFEYEVLLSASNELMRRFRFIVIEFHGLHLLWDSSFYRFAGAAFRKLLQTHTCVHIHPNNVGTCGAYTFDGIKIPRLMEFTFYRNDRFTKRECETEFPNPLDFDCSDRHPPMKLPACWYQ